MAVGITLEEAVQDWMELYARLSDEAIALEIKLEREALVTDRANAGHHRFLLNLALAEQQRRCPELMGYIIEEVNGDRAAQGKIAYRLHGSRGACYRLIRTDPKPHLMFAINRNGNVCAIKGNYSFTDRDGYLTALS